MLEMKAHGQFLISMFCFTLPFVRTVDSEGGYIVECPRPDKGLKEVTCAVRSLIKELETLDTFKAVQEYLITRTSEEKGRFLNLIQGGESCVKEHKSEDKTSSCCNTNCCNKPSRHSASPTEAEVSRLDAEATEGCVTCAGTLLVGPEHAATLFLSTWPHASTVLNNDPDLGPEKESDASSSLSSHSSEDTLVDDAFTTGTVGKLLMDFISMDINKTSHQHVAEEISTIKCKLREVIRYHKPGIASYCCNNT